MTDDLFDKEAEQQIIGSILVAPECMHELDKLGSEDFADPSWRALFTCCVNLWQRGEPIDNVSLFKEFERTAGKGLDVSAAAELIARAGSQTVTASNVSMIAHSVRALGVRRRAIETIKKILESVKDTSVPLDEVLDNARLALDKLNWLPSASRVVLFRDGIEIGGGSPIYEFNVVRPSDLLSTKIRLTSVELDQSGEVRRKIREALHFNPRLPSAEGWPDFIHAIVSLSVRTKTPEALEQDSEMIFWMREWFKTATPAEDPDDLINGYVEKGDMYYIQPQRMLRWLTEHAKVKPNLTMIWSVLQSRGARKDVQIRMKKGPRRLWGIPKDFLNPTEDETQLALDEAEALAEDVDLSALEE